MLIGIITGVPGSVGEALSLFIKWMCNKPPAKHLTTQGNSKLTAYYSFIPLENIPSKQHAVV